MARAIYVTHPDVLIDPAIAVPDWGLAPRGVARARAFATHDAMRDVTRIVSSAERKAVETAQILAAPRGLPVETREAMHENDRSATGFLPPDEFERVADLFFAHPQESIRGWERAADAQARILREVGQVLKEETGGVAFVGHGGVGTLLWCALARVPIDRRHDQRVRGGGAWFAFDFPIDSRRPAVHEGWRSIGDADA